MTVITARHALPVRPRRTLAALIRDFLRPLRRAAEEERAAPVPLAGAAMLGLYGIPDGWTVAGSGGFAVLVPPPAPRHASGERIACGGLSLGTLPRLRTTDRPPWETAQFPAVLDEMPGDRMTDEEYLSQNRYACCAHCEHGEDEDDNHEEPCAEGCNGVPSGGGAG